MSIEDIIDKECDEDPMFVDPTHGFKGTKDEWALYWMEDHMLPSAKEMDIVSDECAIRRVLALAKKAIITKAECTCDARFSGSDEAEYRARGCPECICTGL